MNIELPGTTTAGFVGPALSGPVERPHLVTSAADFAEVYGIAPAPDFLGHAARAFFGQGGTRAYVVRTRTGSNDVPAAYEAGLKALTEVTDVSLVAAPGSSHVTAGSAADRARAEAIGDLLIRHAEQMRDRIALIDSVNGLDLDGVQAQRARINSSYATIYYPWLRAIDPLSGGEVLLPASAFVAGIYARVDAQRGPWKAPANEVARMALGLERQMDAVQQATLNRAGVNGFRVANDRGVVLWGVRTASDDPEWRYVNVRRYCTLLERSIGQGLSWVVFEPNGEVLWSSVRRSVDDFLFTQWRHSALLGERPEQAYFVRCDRSTMTQEDLDQGRLTCLVGVAPVRPAEFVIFRIGLWTGSR